MASLSMTGLLECERIGFGSRTELPSGYRRMRPVMPAPGGRGCGRLLDVLVGAEDTVRIPVGLDGGQPLDAGAVAGAHPLAAFVAEEIGVGRASRPAPHVGAERAGERPVALVVGRVL